MQKKLNLSIGGSQTHSTSGDRFYTLEYDANFLVLGVDYRQETLAYIIALSSSISTYRVRGQARQIISSQFAYLFRFSNGIQQSEFLVGPILEALSISLLEWTRSIALILHPL